MIIHLYLHKGLEDTLVLQLIVRDHPIQNFLTKGVVPFRQFSQNALQQLEMGKAALKAPIIAV